MEPEPLIKSASNRSLKSAFEEPYLGNVHECFVEALEHYSRYSGAAKLYMKSISVVQSSGMGKSRMVDEATNMIFTIPANLREDLPVGETTYPPPDTALRSHFVDHEKKSNELLQAECAILLKHIFATVTSKLPSVLAKESGLTLAVAWANHLKSQSTTEKVGGEREAFYSQALDAAQKVGML
ncbi:unnamed protein product [Rhizoctonia solani]|uniref:Uncharacterized protein n=1 Tax=Rhizoctonia solani TaxID=456999 RepID=A0A8H3BM36_9AGAM|nr:unnamed protein product [Rhizoctonia solani]